MTSKPRVAQVLAGSAQGGAENMYTRLTRALQQSGEFEQRAFLRPHAHRVAALHEAGVVTEGFRFGGPLNLWDRFRYRRALNAYRPDLVMTWMNRASGNTPRGNYVLVNRLGNYYDLKYYRHADYWVGISKGICDHLVRGGMAADRVFHIPNFSDETEVQPIARTSFDTPDGAPIILSAGRLHVNKGFDILLPALARIPDAILWLAGSGPEEAALKQQCEQLGLNARVRFLGWRTDVTALMRSVDLFVCPSRHEGLGSIVMESWAHGCPIVATNSQGPGEAIDHQQTGLLTPVDQIEPLADAIIRLLNDPAERARLVANARQHYQDYYSERVIVSQYNALYTDLLQRR